MCHPPLEICDLYLISYVQWIESYFLWSYAYEILPLFIMHLFMISLFLI
jgi:hypothetical protein